ncbi:hypothetical protein GCM10027598_57660 [Amycolatopsis oliviviridis]|uniref:Uncharacterized protein n=1 Tax=Amycolatopsis oliviviridis TaxID=1471590 RepID=A0ABQ3LXX1_9PSEU|nr:hypothetical protein GCM10017790_58310 [Amycolatopsis oliviviridis]
MKDPQALYEHFGDIDFLIGDRWELRKPMPGTQGEFPARLRDTPGAREAFSAAWIHRVLAKKRNFDHADLEWATAAMSASQASGGVADSMPDVHKVERVVEARVERDRISPKS